MARLGPPPEKPSCLRRLLKGCACGCLVSVLALAVLFLFVRAKLQERPRLPTATKPAAAPPATPAVEQQLEAIGKAAESGRQQQVELRLNEAQLNQLAQDAAKENPQLHDLQLSIRGDTLVASGTVNTRTVLGEVYVTAVARPEMRDGRPSLRIESAKAGSFDLPSAAVQTLQSRLDDTVSQAQLGRQDFQVTNMQITDGELVITGTTIPRR